MPNYNIAGDFFDLVESEMGFKSDCPHYASQNDIMKDDRNFVPKENPNLSWCGDKGSWIKKCDDPCERYNHLFKDISRKGI